MAKHSTKHLKKHQFKKGAPSANPKGRPVISPEQRALRKMTVESYREVIELALTGDLTELKAFAEHPKTPVIQVGVAVCLIKAIKDGDPSVLERFAERLIGKIPDVIKIESNNTNTNLNGEIDKAALRKAMAEIDKDV